MKTGLHPENYRLVVFEDTSNGFRFITRSTAASDETTKWEDGNEYPLIKVHISSASHPFYTGEEKIVDVEGRVDRFKARAEAAAKKREAMANKAKKQAKRSEAKAEEQDTQKLGAKTEQPKPEKPAKDEKTNEKPKQPSPEQKTDQEQPEAKADQPAVEDKPQPEKDNK